MEIHEALFSIGLLIVVAKLLEGIFKRFGLNSIIAYATTGVILGPVTGLVKPGSEIELILGLGIFIFFFLIGLEEIDISGFLAAIRGRLFLASLLSVTISLLVCLAVTTDVFFDLQLDLNFTQALGLAGVLSLSSLGVVARVLIDEGRLREPVGVQFFTAVIIAELIALFVVGFAISEHFYSGNLSHSLDVLSVSTIIGQILGFMIVMWFFSTKVLPKVIVLLQRFFASTAALLWTSAGRTFPGSCRSRKSWASRHSWGFALWRRPFDAALPGAARHYARYERYRRRVLCSSILRVCRLIHKSRVPETAAGDNPGVDFGTSGREIRCGIH